MKNNQIKQLYELYIEGKNYVEKLTPVMDYLAEGKGAVFEVDTLPYGADITNMMFKNNINSFSNCSNLKVVYDDLADFKEGWIKRVTDVLDTLPFYSFRIRFEEASDIKYEGSMEYLNITFSDDMKFAINEASDLCYKVKELAVLIDDYEKKSPQLSADSESVASDDKTDNSPTVFTFEYDSMKGLATVNGLVVHKCNLDSVLDKALTEAVEKPRTSIKARSNIASSIHQFKMPKQLMDLMFRCGNTSLVLNPTITELDIKKSGLDAELLLKELEEKAGKSA